MKVVYVSDLVGTEREVKCPKGGFISQRILLEKDCMGFTMTRTLIPKGKPQYWHYQNHLEACYCIQGEGTVQNVESAKVWTIVPGSIYVLDAHDAHVFYAEEDVVLICIFNPPLNGREVHDSNGSYN